MTDRPGLLRPTDKEAIGTTCYFRNVELDETILHLLGDIKANVLVHADSMGCGSRSLNLLAELHGKEHHIVGGDLHFSSWPLDIREGSDYEWDVVYALNVMCYIPEGEHRAIIKTIASYNTKYLAVSHVTPAVLQEWYSPVHTNSKRIKANWRHPSPSLLNQDVYIWEKKTNETN